DRTISFQLKSGVGLFGGYAGIGAANPDARDVLLYQSVLTGEGPTTSGSDNSYHVVNGSGTDATAVLDGFTIRRGSATGIGNLAIGGGIFISAGSPTIGNCVFTNNGATKGGGAG